MTSIRESLAAKCRLGSFEFWASAVSGGGSRRLAKYNAVGVEGSQLEDLGEDARTEELSAILTETEWIELDNLRREVKILTCVHPLFGVFEGRIEKATYEADQKEGVSVKITLVEDGSRALFAPPVVSSSTGTAQAAKGASSAFQDGLDDLDWLSDLPEGLTDSAAILGDSLDSWDSILDTIDQGLSSWEEIGAEFDSLSVVVSDFIDQLDSAAAGVVGLADLVLEDLAYAALSAGRAVVDAVGSVVSSTTQPFRVKGEVSLAGVARDLMPTMDVDEAIDQLLTLNPTIIDLNCVTAGSEITIPVNL